MPIVSKMRTLGDAGLYKYKWCNNLREVEQVNIFFLKDIADTIRYFVGNDIGFLYHNESKLFICVPDSSIANAQHAVSQLFNSNIVVEYQNNTNLVEVLSAELSALLGEGNYGIKFNNDERLITIDIPFTMSLNLENVNKILNRVYLINVELLVDSVPVEYTHLEYLESSGTQYIETQLEVDSTWGAKVEWEMTKIANYSNVLSGNNSNLAGQIINAGGFSVPYWNGVYANFYAVFMSNGEKTYFLDRDAQVGVRYTSEMNFFNSRRVKLNTESLGIIPETVQSFLCKNPILFGSSRNGTPLNTARLTGKIFSTQISKDSTIKMYLVPVLDENGTPCMFDKVSRKCFYNTGKGTFGYRIKRTDEKVSPMSLRDPYYVPPSGVYARMVDENKLEMLADTEETIGDNWEHFTNTAEAYEHFDIKEEPLNNI